MSHTDEALGLSLPSQDAPVSIAVGASVFTYTTTNSGVVIVAAGTVSFIELGRGATFISCGVTSGAIPVSKGDKVRVTYSVLPTMTFIRR